MSRDVGFVGLGLMGSAIASRLLAAHPLTVWNRSGAARTRLARQGADVAATAAEVFDLCRTVFVMVSDENAVDEILLDVDVRGTTLVQMSTVPPAYSAALAQRVQSAGGRYVEAPVSGSRQPALDGRLIGMLAGPAAALDDVEALLAPACAKIVRCGEPPRAMQMKLAVNTFLITVVTGLAESFHFAEEHGLDRRLLEEILNAGPMASFVSRAKAAALVSGDFSPQAAIPDVLKNARLVVESAYDRAVAVPLMAECARLYDEADELGRGADDMAAVIHAHRARTALLRAHPDALKSGHDALEELT
jgi:3-hydroxyisobutyrate dehydrogenase